MGLTVATAKSVATWRVENGQGFLIRCIEALPITSGMLTGQHFEIQA